MIDPWALWPDPPRAWQVRAYDTLIPIIRGRPPRAVIAQACTGAGKTRFQIAVLANILSTLRDDCVIVVFVPKEKLVEQTYDAARAVLPVGSVGRWYGSHKEPSRVTVVCNASAGTFIDWIGTQGKRVGFWMDDEAHRADSDKHIAVIQRANPYCRLGVTATPFPPTGSTALRGWDEIAFRYPLDEAVEDRVLVPFRFYGMREHLGPGVSYDGGEDVNEVTIEMIKRGAPRGPGIVDATDIKDAEWYAEQLTANGIPAVAVHSKLKKGLEGKRIAALLRGEYRALVHVDLLTEGRDIPGLRWIVMRRPRGSAIAIAQYAGRASRTCKDDDPTVAWAGPKTEAVIIMPRYSPVLESINQVGEVTPELTAQRLQAAAEREAAGPPREVVLPLTEAVKAFDGYLQALLRQAAEEGIKVEADTPDDGWRNKAPTGMQVALLADLTDTPRRSPVKNIPASGREVVRAVVSRPGILTRGQVQDLLRLLRGVRDYAVKYARERVHLPENRRFWRGMMEAKTVIEPAAERALRGGG
jgi:hypothetical protein